MTNPNPPPSSLQTQNQTQKKIPPCNNENNTTGSNVSTSVEELTLDAMELQAYQDTAALLQQEADFLAPFPTVVSLRDLRREPLETPASATNTTAASSATTTRPAGSSMATSISLSVAAAAGGGLASSEEVPTSLLSPNKGHHALFRALEELEGLEKEEATLVEHCPLTAPLTTIVTRPDDEDRSTTTTATAPSTTATPESTTRAAREALAKLREFGSIPRRVCQHPFKRNDIVWVCRTCQADETCVLCHACFSQSYHEGHDVAFYHAQAGGCCDCGDPDAWDPAGFCPRHGPSRMAAAGAKHDDDTMSLSEKKVKRVRGVIPAAIDWMVDTIARNAEAGYQRATMIRTDRAVTAKEVRQAMFRQNPQPNILDPTQAAAAVETFSTSLTAQQYPTQPEAITAALPSQDEPPTNNNIDDDLAMDGHSNPTAGAAFHDSDFIMDFYDHGLHHQPPPDADAENDALFVPHDVFSPLAASRSRQLAPEQPNTQQQHADPSAQPPRITKSEKQTASQPDLKPPAAPNYAEELGKLGREGGGLFLVLHADDIHSPPQWVDALREFLGASSYYTDSLLAKFVRELRQFGQLVVWGTLELSAECGATKTQLWLDGDRVAAAQIATALLNRAKRLVRNGFFCSIVTRHELHLEQRAVAVLQWLSALARSCDPLCQTVAERILPNRHLVPLLRADFKLSARITKAWYSLLLTLLAVPTFKSHLAAAYCDTYRAVTAKYARGMGVLERSAYTLSVQFLNRVTYVVDLVQGRDLLGKLGKSLLETLQVAKSTNLGGRLNPNHFVLSHRRYSPCISDLKCVLNVKGMKRLFASQEGTFLQDWISALSLAQFMDAQVWRHWTQGHIEDEVRGWVGAFNLSISLGSLFERLLSWDDDEPSPIQDPSSPLSKNLMTCVYLTYHILVNGLIPWQRGDPVFSGPTLFTSAIDPHKRCPASLPFSTIAAKHGCALALRQLPIAQITAFSFHLPLHRFLAACLREVCRRSDDCGMGALLDLVDSDLSETEHEALLQGIMEFPVLVLSRAAQVRAGLWRRNGPGLNDQVLNYAEPPFCRSMRDADLLLVQFAVLQRTAHQSPNLRPQSDVGVAFLVHLLLHRMGIFDFTGLAKAPNSDIPRYLDEVSRGLYPPELKAETAADGDTVLPWTYSPARDSATRLVLLEEFLHMIIIFTSELPPLPPGDKDAHTSQAKRRLRREVIHRLVSGPKTHSELSEVHLVLSHWDNVFLSDEGKLVNPDDATGAALGTVLEEVADRKSSRGKLEPDKWELRRSVWEEYDPSFFHISLRNHQTAAEYRPQANSSSANKNITKAAKNSRFGEPKAYAPVTPSAHPVFERLRRDVTADATVLAVAYRILHLHCREKAQKEGADLRGGKFTFDNDERSETALARAVHILTLGAYAWEDATANDIKWRNNGGGSAGSIFFNRADDEPAPSVSDWIKAALLADPAELLDCEWYEKEEAAFALLRKLAVDGGVPGNFVAQDPSVRAGAGWLCEFAVKYCPFAAAQVSVTTGSSTDVLSSGEKAESELEKKKRLAKEKALSAMKDQAAKFASMMEVELDENGSEDDNNSTKNLQSGVATEVRLSPAPGTPQAAVRYSSLGSFGTRSSSPASYDHSGAESEQSLPQLPFSPEIMTDGFEDSLIPSRLLKQRPQCIICSDDSNAETRNSSRSLYDEEGHRRSRRRKIDGGNALAFVAYAQASTVLRGGGGPPCSAASSMAPARRFVGAHVALCGHAVHSECCESYLATVSHREDRIIGKRDEFRCPLCQRLSNCLVPFIDVGVDWAREATCLPVSTDNNAQNAPNGKSEDSADMVCDNAPVQSTASESLHDFVSTTPWWVSRRNPHVVWDGQSAFVGKVSSSPVEESTERAISSETSSASKPRRRSVRSLRKKDLYAAWNAMMRTPRFVRRRFRPRSADDTAVATRGQETLPTPSPDPEESSGETVVWRRFMDQVCDIAYRADSKRLGEEDLHSDFGEFRHYIVEKFSYNLAKRSVGIEPADWPSCVFSSALSETQRQELSREKLLSKLLMSIKSFTYSCCCEASEARRAVRKAMLSSSDVAGMSSDAGGIEAVYSKFGISGVLCDGKLILIPRPSPIEDEGSQPFNGRVGRLRYLALAVMAAAGAVAADLVQLVLPFPQRDTAAESSDMDMDVERPERAPIAYPILLGHVLTHVVAAMCASCGRARARSDSLELVWPVPFSIRGSFAFSGGGAGNGRKCVDSVVEDCEGFLKLGLLARILQVILAKLEASSWTRQHAASVMNSIGLALANADLDRPVLERKWVQSCFKLLEAALSYNCRLETANANLRNPEQLMDSFHDACVVAAGAACSFLSDACTILQVIVPGVMSRYEYASFDDNAVGLEGGASLQTLEKLLSLLRFEPMDEMLKSSAVREIAAAWYDTACTQIQAASFVSDITSALDSNTAIRGRLFKTQGFRSFDWPLESVLEQSKSRQGRALRSKESSDASSKISFKVASSEPQDESTSMQIEAIHTPRNETTAAELLRRQTSPSLMTVTAKKTVPLIGEYRCESPATKTNVRPRIAVIPTSYTDLYAELGVLLPDCEQTAVCLVCGEVLNAGGKGECTKHSYKCGAGMGMFFLLQECSGLIMHKGKAAYIHSPYVDSHGETPQYRGRPLNLDLARYDHLREVWLGHAVRQTVLAERGSSRQVIVPDFY